MAAARLRAAAAPRRRTMPVRARRTRSNATRHRIARMRELHRIPRAIAAPTPARAAQRRRIPADVAQHLRTLADVVQRLLTPVDVVQRLLTPVGALQHQRTPVDAVAVRCRRIRAVAVQATPPAAAVAAVMPQRARRIPPAAAAAGAVRADTDELASLQTRLPQAARADARGAIPSNVGYRKISRLGVDRLLNDQPRALVMTAPSRIVFVTGVLSAISIRRCHCASSST